MWSSILDHGRHYLRVPRYPWVSPLSSVRIVPFTWPGMSEPRRPVFVSSRGVSLRSDSCSRSPPVVFVLTCLPRVRWETVQETCEIWTEEVTPRIKNSNRTSRNTRIDLLQEQESLPWPPEGVTTHYLFLFASTLRGNGRPPLTLYGHGHRSLVDAEV